MCRAEGVGPPIFTHPTPQTKSTIKHQQTRVAWPKGPRKFKATEHWPQIFVYFTQSLRDKVSGGQERAGGGFPGGQCPEATTAGQTHIPALHNHWIPATKRNPRLVFPAYRGNTNNPKALGKASGLGSCLCFSEM